MIDFVKFVELLLPMTFDADLEAELKEAFAAFDEDETGRIDASTLRHLIVNIAPTLDDDEVDELLNEANIDKDGKANYAEFAKLVSAK